MEVVGSLEVEVEVEVEEEVSCNLGYYTAPSTESCWSLDARLMPGDIASRRGQTKERQNVVEDDTG